MRSQYTTSVPIVTQNITFYQIVQLDALFLFLAHHFHFQPSTKLHVPNTAKRNKLWCVPSGVDSNLCKSADKNYQYLFLLTVKNHWWLFNAYWWLFNAFNYLFNLLIQAISKNLHLHLHFILLFFLSISIQSLKFN